MSARDLGKLRVGSAWLGVVERADGEEILTFTAPPGVAPLDEAEYERIMVATIVRMVVAHEANLARAALVVT